jgi:two-component system chemotaxis response regulator CheB
MIRVLVVDDSPTVRQLMVYELDRQKDMQVVGVAENGAVAIRQAQKLKPDVITMDLKMPEVDGLEATREIMCSQAIPVVIVSQFMDQDDKQQCFEALSAGAVAVANKPAGPGHPEYESALAYLLHTIRIMSEVRVITRRRTQPAPARLKPAMYLPEIARTCRRVLIGASTGGPVALKELFALLKSPFPCPIFVVQHIAKGFLVGFVDWLSKATPHTIEIAEHGILPKNGHIYFAPDDKHMTFAENGTIRLSSGEKEHSLRPSISNLFRSGAQNGAEKTIAVLLTGMGADGAKELKELKDAGAITVAQNEESCVVFGMPGEAVKINAATHILPPDEIAQLLNKITS